MVSKAQVATGILALCLAVVTASPASADYDKDELKCRKVTSKIWGKTVKIGQKVVGKCHKLRNTAKVSALTDCNLLDVANADSKGKFAKLQGKLQSTVQNLCRDTGLDDDVLDQYISCPEPCTTDFGLNNPLSSYDDLASCMSCMAREAAQDFGVATQGSPVAPMASKDDQKCHSLISKGYGKYLFRLLKERSGCQNDAEKSLSAETLADSGCLGYDAKMKIDGARIKAESLLDKSCPAATLANLDSCTATNLADLKTCLDAVTADDGNDAVTEAYELDPTICPTSITSSVVAGTPVFGGPATATVLEAGWNGIGHGQDIVHGTSTSLGIDCGGATPPCGSCPITGIVDAGVQYSSFTRCREAPWTECATPFATDPVCPGLQECAYFLSPPAPLSASNTPTCAMFRLENDATGSFNVETGDVAQDLAIRAAIHTGIALNQPCPVCAGDTTAQDGSTDGLCSGGLRDGEACDVQGFDATFAAGEGISLDCPPDPLSNISGAGLQLALDLTTGSVALPFNVSCDFPLGGEACACGVCSNDSAQACNSDVECPGGTCTSNGGGQSRAPNSCGDGVCTDMGGEKGSCLAGPVVKSCDEVVRANGGGYILCSTDAECEVGAIGINAGACTLEQTRSCFLDPINATGTPDPDAPIAVSTFCVPPTSSSGVNAATGLPGPSRATIQLLVDRNY